MACGQCIGCRIDYTRSWAIRIYHEATLHPVNSFVTLTLDDTNIPESRSLDIRHWQLFAKRFRQALGPLRFYHCGEYGEQTQRPHYHAILFGHNFQKDRKKYTHNLKTTKNQLYISETLNNLWQLGNCQIGDVTYQSAGYVAGYIQKKITGKQAKEHYEFIEPSTGQIFDRKPAYSTMSRKPGIGSSWYDDHWRQIYPRDEVVVDGCRQQPPKYYDLKYQKSHPLEFEKILQKRKARALTQKQNSTPNRLRVRAEVKRLEAKAFTREPTK